MSANVSFMAYFALWTMMIPYVVLSQLSSFTITTDSINPGNGQTVTITMYWNTNQYSCSFNPTSSQINTPFTCDSSVWTQTIITANAYIPYYLKLRQQADIAPIQFKSIDIQDISGNTYTITEFCIG